jgi:hypothetical protein
MPHGLAGLRHKVGAVSDPTHQLVVQFPEDSFLDFDALVSFEDYLYETLGDRHEVDGHDIGSGEVNFFVFTDDPRAALAEIQAGHVDRFSRPGVRAAARRADGEDYELLWPVGDTRAFTIA